MTRKTKKLIGAGVAVFGAVLGGVGYYLGSKNNEIKEAIDDAAEDVINEIEEEVE